MTEEAPDTPLPAVRTLGQDESGADSPGPFSADYQGFFELKDILALQKRKPRRLSFSEEKSHRKLVLALVGLPARGKSYIAKKILNYALWRGHVVRVFNVGNFRREVFKEDDMAHFFDPDDPEMKRAREKLAEGVLEQALHWLLEESGQIAIFDATNSVKSRRRLVKNKCESAGVRLLFIESVCDDPAVLESNMKTKIAKSPDYLHMEFEAALKDLEMRIQNYAKVYETIDDEEDLSYVKLVNLQSKVICHHIKGYFCRLLVFYLMNLKINRRPIWLVRAGDCQDSTEHDEDHQLSHVHFNDCRLSDNGIEFARRLAVFVETYRPDSEGKWDSPVFTPGDYLVWTSTLKRAAETATFIPKKKMQWNALNMLDRGIYEGWSMEKFRETDPDNFKAWQQDMKGFRFPGGESYNDVAERLEPLVMDLEAQTKPVLIISHLSCLRVLYAYFQGKVLHNLHETKISRTEVIEFTPTQYGWQEKRFQLMEDSRWASRQTV